jgi:hypothetical protein
VVSRGPGAGGPTRRQVLVGAGAGAGALLLGGCGGHHRAAGQHRTGPARPPHPDVALLNRSLDLEHEAIAAYTAGIPLLSGRAQDAAKRFLDQELAHAGELSGLVKQAGGKPLKARTAYDLGHPRDTGGVLALLESIEARQLAVHLDALPRLSEPTTRAAVGAVLGSDAQHLALLRVQLRRDPIPVVVAGSAPPATGSGR